MPRLLAHRLRDEIDWVLLCIVALISIAGVVNSYSTGVATGQPELYLSQIYFLVFGGCAAAVVAAVDYHHYERWGYLLYAVGIFLLVLVLIPGIGIEVNGARRWLFGFQPSELMKVLLVVGLARYLHQDPHDGGRKLTDLFIPAAMTGLAMMLIFKEPDLGTSLMCLLIFLSIMMLTRLKPRSMLTLVLSAPVVAFIAWNFLIKEYQKERVISFWKSFVDPESDRLGAGWHAFQSEVAIGSGRVAGKGFLNGTAGPHHFLPEQTTDFPFAVFAEEHGFIGAMILVLLYCILIMWCLRVAANARDRFGAVVAVGIGSVFLWHVLYNLGMVMGLMPVTGVTLPLFSAGGSSIVTFLLGIGLLMNVSIHRHRI